MKHSLALKRNLCLQNLPSSHGKFLDHACWTHCCYLMFFCSSNIALTVAMSIWMLFRKPTSRGARVLRSLLTILPMKEARAPDEMIPSSHSCLLWGGKIVFTAASSRKVGSGTHLELTCWKRVRPCWNMLKHLLRITESETCLPLPLATNLIPFYPILPSIAEVVHSCSLLNFTVWTLNLVDYSLLVWQKLLRQCATSG